MESVLQKIRQARDDDNKRRADACITEAVVDGCQVIMRFDADGDSKVMSAIKSMLMSAHMDAAFSTPRGGE